MRAQGWNTDPFGRHADRWFSDGRPTSLVRDGDRESDDPPPPDEVGEPPPGGVVTATAGEARVDGPVDVQPPVAGFGERVEFGQPRGRVRAGWRLWFNSAYFLALGGWAVAGSWHRYRVLGIVSGLVYLELMLATFRLATLSGAVMYDQGMARRIAVPLIELCRRARCAVPNVVVRDDAVRAASVRRRRGRVSLVVSGPFVDRVDDRQLRALLAHEVIHIARNDFAPIRIRAWGSAGVIVAVCAVIGILANGTVIFPVFLAIALLSGMLANVGLSLFNRPLERRADIEGAQLCDDPAGLASALTVAHGFSREARLRVFGPLPWRWVLSPLSWTPPTHPPMAQRVSVLERIAASRAC